MRARWGLIFAALILLAGGAAGYVVGAHRSNFSVLTGTFYIGDHQAEGSVDGWSYGLRYSVAWLSSNNVWYQDGWPDCLGPIGTTRTVRFGYTAVDGPSGSWRQIVWLSCLP